jgi:hypothetical protein
MTPMSECAQCGAPMQEGQDWCLQCGAGAVGSLGGGPGWRTGAAILAATVLLVAGASVAAYAALTKPKPKPKVVAVAIRPVASTPTPTVPGTSTGTLPAIPTTVAPAPKIPTQTPTPTPAAKGSEPSEPVFPGETNTASSTKSSSTKSSTESGKGAEGGGKEKTESQSGSEPPSPILLDTNAASVYNPYAYPASLFGDPSLTIDGEGKTAWTAQVQPEKAPNMAEGLLLDLKSPQKLGSATVKSTTTGATVEIYGAVGSAPAASITDPAWVRLVGLKKLKKKDTTFKLKTKGKSYRFVVLWLVKAPPGSTAAKPGEVAIDEFELFPPS